MKRRNPIDLHGWASSHLADTTTRYLAALVATLALLCVGAQMAHWQHGQAEASLRLAALSAEAQLADCRGASRALLYAPRPTPVRPAMMVRR